MALTLHEALVPGWLQVLGSVGGLVGKAEAWCEEEGHSPSELIGARLSGSMLPFAYQVASCWTHSAYAVQCAQEGEFTPYMDPPPEDFEGLREKLDDASRYLEELDPDLLESIAGNEMTFRIGEKIAWTFGVQDFLLRFSTLNFYFHAATAYDVLRMKGLDIGKRDYLGALPIR